jgi:hypothetical protein
LTLARAMLADDALRVTPDGVELDLHLSWYRSLPLSSVQEIDLSIGGEPVARDEIVFGVNGNEYALDELAERYEEIWFVLDPATLKIARPLATAGSPTEVVVRLTNRIPYILIGPDRPLEFATERTATLVAR